MPWAAGGIPIGWGKNEIKTSFIKTSYTCGSVTCMYFQHAGCWLLNVNLQQITLMPMADVSSVSVSWNIGAFKMVCCVILTMTVIVILNINSTERESQLNFDSNSQIRVNSLPYSFKLQFTIWRLSTEPSVFNMFTQYMISESCITIKISDDF